MLAAHEGHRRHDAERSAFGHVGAATTHVRAGGQMTLDLAERLRRHAAVGIDAVTRISPVECAAPALRTAAMVRGVALDHHRAGGAGDLGGGVGAPVGHHHHFHVALDRPGGVRDRREARGEVPLLVVRRHDHRNPGHAVSIVTHPANLDADLWGVLHRAPQLRQSGLVSRPAPPELGERGSAALPGC